MSISVAVIHNEASLALPYGDFLANNGFEVQVFTTLQQLTDLISRRRRLPVDVALIHKGLCLEIRQENDAGIEESWPSITAMAIDRLESTVRRIIFAGEYPTAVNRVVHDFKGDHYVAIDAATDNPKGLIKLINQGQVSPEEIRLRGESVGLINGERIRPDSGLRVEKWWG